MVKVKAAASLHWGKALRNGLYAWLLGLALYMIPAFVVAFRMGFEMGPKGIPQAEISHRISAAIPAMYRENLWLNVGYSIILALLVIWRARVVAWGSGGNAVKLGLLVAFVPVLVSLVTFFTQHMDPYSLLDAIILGVAGYVGGSTAKSVPS